MLIEGLKLGDLENLCLNTISIDQFNSKISEDCIVVAFYVLYRNPAKDLNSFIQKTSVDIIDSDVSPAPTEDGYYIVFVEFKRDNKFPQKIVDLCSILRGITQNPNWYFRTMKETNATPLNVENIKKTVPGVSNNIKESIFQYFKNSCLDGLNIQNNTLIFEKYGAKRSYSFISFGNKDSLLESLNSIPISESDLSDNNYFRNILGNNWYSDTRGKYIFLKKDNSNRALILKKQ